MAFVAYDPFGVDPFASGLQLALVAVPFVLLALLTYLSARAIEGDEQDGPVYHPGQTATAATGPVATEGDESTDGSSGGAFEDAR